MLGLMNMIEDIYKEFSALPEVQAIALGGSRATGNNDKKSDYDIYIYLTTPLSPEIRKHILDKYVSYLELNNQFWENEDNGTFKDGVDFDILYRNLDDFTDSLSYVVEKHNAYNNYTTCFWHNLLTSKIVYDKYGNLAKIVERFNVPYPEELKQNIINRGMRLLTESIASFEYQIKKAVERKDMVSILHRTTEFMAVYFDIIWAINKKTHPGEKRLVELTERECPILPADFRSNIDILFKNMFIEPESNVQNIANMVAEIKKLIGQ